MALRCSAEPRYDCRAASPAQACLLHGFRVRMHPSVLPASCGLQAHTHACTPHTHACTPHTHLQLWRQWSASDRDAFGNDVCESLCYRCLARAWLSKQQRIVLLPARQDLTDSGELRRTADHLHQALRDSDRMAGTSAGCTRAREAERAALEAVAPCATHSCRRKRTGSTLLFRASSVRSRQN
jgi:hypothetical protein